MDPTNQINEEIQRGARWIPALLFLLLLTLLAGVIRAMIHTPKDLEHRAIRTLQDADLSQNDFKLRFSGRDAELWWGADDAAQERAVALIEKVPGVRQVTVRRYPAQVARAATSSEGETPAAGSSTSEPHEPVTGVLVTPPGAPREPAQPETAPVASNADLAGSNQVQAVQAPPVDGTSAVAGPATVVGTSVPSNEPGPTGQTPTVTSPSLAPSAAITEADAAPGRVSPWVQDRSQAPHEGEAPQGVPPGPPAPEAIPSSEPTAPSQTQPPAISSVETEVSTQEGESGPDHIEPTAQPGANTTEAGATPVEGEEPEESRPVPEHEVGTQGPATHSAEPSPTGIESAKLAQSPGTTPESELPATSVTPQHPAATTPIEAEQPEPAPTAPEQGGGGASAPTVPVASEPEEAVPPPHEPLTSARSTSEAAATADAATPQTTAEPIRTAQVPAPEAPEAAATADAVTPQTTAEPIRTAQVPPPEQGREAAPPIPVPEGGTAEVSTTAVASEASGPSPLPRDSAPIPMGEASTAEGPASTVNMGTGESTPHARPAATWAAGSGRSNAGSRAIVPATATRHRTVLGRMLFVPGTAHPSRRGYAAIVQLAQIMRAQPDLWIEIGGYGERLSFGPYLGFARALVVKRYLMAMGIPASRLLPRAYHGRPDPALGPGPEELQIRFTVFKGNS